MEQEYIVEINGKKFDTRNMYDRLYLESIGYDFEIKKIKKNKKEVKSEENKKVEKVEYDENGRQVFNCPMNTAYIKDKKMDYKTLGIMTIFSNRKSEVVARDISEAEAHRYLYEKGNNSIWSNRKEIEKLSGNKIKTIRANMNKLVKCGNDVVTYNEDDNGGYYKIIPCANDGTKSKDGSLKGSYVIIDSRILQYLVNVYNSTAIKIYCTLKWLLYDKETEKEIERQLTIDFICKQIGLNEVSGKNRKMVSDVLNTFSKVGLINRKSFTYCNDKGDFITSYKYSINNYKTFKRIFSGK